MSTHSQGTHILSNLYTIILSCYLLERWSANIFASTFSPKSLKLTTTISLYLISPKEPFSSDTSDQWLRLWDKFLINLLKPTLTHLFSSKQVPILERFKQHPVIATISPRVIPQEESLSITKWKIMNVVPKPSRGPILGFWDQEIVGDMPNEEAPLHPLRTSYYS
jgi:hypothetical protein